MNNLKGIPLLYSTGTELAYRIAKEYYNDIHYVWCTTSFDAPLQPGTSNPRTLCNRYLSQICRCDEHATEIENNKAGILRGALKKLSDDIITEEQHQKICGIVKYSRMIDFYPVIYIIHKSSAKKRSKAVSPSEAASTKSVEYKIEDLKNDEFHLIRLKDILNGAIELPW